VYRLKVIVFKILMPLALLLASHPNSVAEEELCAAFKHSSVDPSLIAMMLTAAEQGGLYRIESSSSSVGFCANSAVGRIEAEFTAFQGGVSLLPASTRQPGYGQTLVRVDARSLDTKGALLSELLKSESFFDVERFPEILFVSTDLRWESPTRGALEGKLTLRGVTRPVTFDVEMVGIGGVPLEKAEQVRVKATTTIRASDFGMKAVPRFAEDAVELCMTVDAIRYSS
jgi:polyisoprenoid-binding protein YceI